MSPPCRPPLNDTSVSSVLFPASFVALTPVPQSTGKWREKAEGSRGQRGSSPEKEGPRRRAEPWQLPVGEVFGAKLISYTLLRDGAVTGALVAACCHQ